ncbi:hypothetical protein EXIGLDRAFT_720299 [Exidia glandulosa HHB12029]|uniref:Protein kinase domain-containing protein n=1 Tax=Exidia glandulosa HHB12029 TaxID=1314781 RepID=A0A165GHH7_EXIGL|nr:hypothetical protein EXIGLDRAFT_720299 [Exidia glandulosa HHB12029]
MTTALPESIRALKAAHTPLEIHPRALWAPFETFFASHGITLWKEARGYGSMEPPDDRVRAPDGFFYRMVNPRRPEEFSQPGFTHTLATVCPGRTSDGRDVVIRIVSIGDEGLNHRVALERLSTGNVASLIGNHTVPVLQWLELENVTFAVQPLLSPSDPLSMYAYEDVEDLLKTMVQMLEGVAFCHSKLVAHFDLWDGNFLSNYNGDPGPAWIATHDRDKPVPPFRSTFPFKIYIIDFETCVHFDEESDPSTRFVTGLPPTMQNGVYRRLRYPELSSDTPYDPFLVDVWQLGTRFKCLLMGYSELAPDEDDDAPLEGGESAEDEEDPEGLRSIPAAIVALVDRMIEVDPAKRPTAAVALAELRNIMAKLSKDELKAPV